MKTVPCKGSGQPVERNDYGSELCPVCRVYAREPGWIDDATDTLLPHRRTINERVYKSPRRRVVDLRQRYQTLRVTYRLECGHSTSRTYNVLDRSEPITHPKTVECVYCREDRR